MKAKVVSVQLSLLPRSPSRAASGCERPLWEISSSEGFVELQLVAVVGSSSPGVFAASDASRGSACGATTRGYRFGGFLELAGVADAEWERTLSVSVVSTGVYVRHKVEH